MLNNPIQVKSTSPLDIAKWCSILLLVGVGIWANYHYSQIDWSLRLAAWIVLSCFLLWFSLQTKLGRALWRFIKDARMELYKVVWPTRPETIQTTLFVMLMVVIMSLILWGLDSVLLWILSLLTGQKG